MYGEHNKGWNAIITLPAQSIFFYQSRGKSFLKAIVICEDIIINKFFDSSFRIHKNMQDRGAHVHN